MNYLGALSAGYTSKQILNYISKSFPEIGHRINEALAAGKTAEEVMKYLGKFDKNQFSKVKGRSKSTLPFPEEGYQSAYSKGEQATNEYNPIPESIQTAGKLALPLAGGVAVAGLASKAAPMLQKALQHAAPQLLGPNSLPNQMQGQLLETLGKNQETPLQPPINQVEPIIPQSTQVLQPEGIYNSKEYLEKHGILDKVKDLLSRGNSPEQVSAALGIQRSGGTKIDPELTKNIEEFAKNIEGDKLLTASQPIPENVTTTVPTQEMQDMLGKEKLHTDTVKEPSKVSKGTLASFPNGVGEVLEIRGKEAIIDVDGKKHKVAVDELESEPEDVAELYDKLFEALPAEHKSRMMNYAGYDEGNNELLFRPHGGGAYVYKDIPPEFVEQLKNQLHKAKTSGKNMYGAWTEGDKSYGAGMSKLIKELQAAYGGRGKEYIRKYDTLFDILGLPHELKKQKEKAERERRKQK